MKSAREVRSGFQGAEGKPCGKEGRALRETMERSAEVAREIVLLSRLVPVSRLNKAGPHFSRFLAKSCPATGAFSSLCLFKPSIILLLLLASRTVEAVNAGPNRAERNLLNR